MSVDGSHINGHPLPQSSSANANLLFFNVTSNSRTDIKEHHINRIHISVEYSIQPVGRRPTPPLPTTSLDPDGHEIDGNQLGRDPIGQETEFRHQMMLHFTHAKWLRTQLLPAMPSTDATGSWNDACAVPFRMM